MTQINKGLLEMKMLCGFLSSYWLKDSSSKFGLGLLLQIWMWLGIKYKLEIGNWNRDPGS